MDNNDTYLKYDIARLLDRIGFDIDSPARYASGRIVESYWDDYRERTLNFTWQEGHFLDPESASAHEISGPTVPAPTLQSVARFIREKYSLHIAPYKCSLGWHFEIFDLREADITGCRKAYSVGIPSAEQCRDTFENALEDGIQHYILEMHGQEKRD